MNQLTQQFNLFYRTANETPWSTYFLVEIVNHWLYEKYNVGYRTIVYTHSK